MTQFLLTSKSPCIATPTTTETFLPTTALLLAEIPKKEESKKEEVKNIEPTTFPQTTFSSQPTATLSADLLFDLVNNHRKSLGLPPFEHEPRVCSVAESRKDEIVNEALVTHNLHAGFYAKNLPYFATENMIYQHTEAEALSWWLHSPIHRSALEGNHKYACGVCNGQVCNMVFTNYETRVVSDTHAAPIDQKPTEQASQTALETKPAVIQALQNTTLHSELKINL